MCNEWLNYLNILSHLQRIKSPILYSYFWLLARIGFSIAILCALNGCVSTAVSSASAVYNRQAWQDMITDHHLQARVSNLLKKQALLNDESNITITVYHQVVLLTGYIASEKQKNAMTKATEKIPGVVRVFNQLLVQPGATAALVLHDSWLTTKIKTKLLVNPHVDPRNIKVVTENGEVFLMGHVTHQEGASATQTAADTEGVKRVVQMFRYIVLSSA